MRIELDKRFQVLTHWNEQEQMWQWAVTDTTDDNVQCGTSANQVDLFGEAIEIAKKWRQEDNGS